jgi:hypothetical protein
MLIPNNKRFVWEVTLDVFGEDDWDQFGVNSDQLASCLALGDNFAMNAKEGNSEGVDFYILMCTKPMYTLFASYKCPWGYQFNACDVVVARRYYQKWGHFEHLNVFLKGFHVVILDVCNV